MKPKLLDLFCGAGGCSVGYHRAGFQVVGVDNKPQKNYPFGFIQADAMTLPLDGFDVIHASPPCQAYSTMTNLSNTQSHLDLIPETRARLIQCGLPYVIENVPRSPLRNPVVLCGTQFGLGVARHRMFESNLTILGKGECSHDGLDLMSVLTKSCRKIGDLRGPSSVEKGKLAMGIDWMTQFELGEAIPPAYTEWIGKQLMKSLTPPAPSG